MDKPRKTFGLFFFSTTLILHGMAMTLFCLAAIVLGLDTITGFIMDFRFAPNLLFYYQFSGMTLHAVLVTRLLLGLAQIGAGVMLLEYKPLGARAASFLIMTALALSFLNPYFKTFYLLALLLWSMAFLYFLHHSNFLNRCLAHEADKINKPRRIRRPAFVLFLACLEIVFGVSFLRKFIYMAPHADMFFSLPFLSGYWLVIQIPAWSKIAFSGIFLAAGYLTITRTRAGRFLNIIFCLLSFLVSLAGILLINQSLLGTGKLTFFIAVIATLVVSSSLFMFFLNPEVKKEFK